MSSSMVSITRTEPRRDMSQVLKEIPRKKISPLQESKFDELLKKEKDIPQLAPPQVPTYSASPPSENSSPQLPSRARVAKSVDPDENYDEEDLVERLTRLKTRAPHRAKSNSRKSVEEQEEFYNEQDDGQIERATERDIPPEEDSVEDRPVRRARQILEDDEGEVTRPSRQRQDKEDTRDAEQDLPRRLPVVARRGRLRAIEEDDDIVEPPRRTAVKTKSSGFRRSRGSQPIRQDGSTHDATGSLELSKTQLAKMAKFAGVPSRESDTDATCKILAENFVQKVLSQIERKDGEEITIATVPMLESIVANILKEDINEIDEDFINLNKFFEYLQGETIKENIKMKREAMSWLAKAVEYYLLILFEESKQIAQNARRSRIKSNDLQMASRMFIK